LVKLYVIIKKVFIQFVISVYIILSITSLTSCSRANSTKTTFERLSEKKVSLIKMLEVEFNAKSFQNFSKNLVNQNIVFDTSVVAVSKRGTYFYLKAQIRNNKKNNYFGLFRCNKAVFKQFSETKTNGVLLVAKVSGIQEQLIQAISDSLDGRLTEFSIGNAILLTGDCLALRAVPTFNDEI
jgi:hypothetical protein